MANQVCMLSILPGVLSHAKSEFIIQFLSPESVSILLMMVVNICSLGSTVIEKMIVTARQIRHIAICLHMIERSITNLNSWLVLVRCIGWLGGRYRHWGRQASFLFVVLFVWITMAILLLLDLNHVL